MENLKHGTRKVRHTKMEITEFKKLMNLLNQLDYEMKSYLVEYFEMEVLNDREYYITDWIKEVVESKKELLVEEMDMNNMYEVLGLMEILNELLLLDQPLLEAYVNKIPRFVNVENDTLFTSYEVRKVIKNTNGKNYVILAGNEFTTYTLLKGTSLNVFNEYEFIVAYGLKKYDEGYSWLKGYYMECIEDATDLYNSKRGF